MDDFTNILREHNLKATPQRLAMMESIYQYGHINIDKLYENVKQKFHSISLATIYKNINAMTKEMLLLEVKLPNEKSVYEIVKTDHSHLLCKKCGLVEDIKLDTSNIVSNIGVRNNFRIEHADIVLSGVCKSCS